MAVQLQISQPVTVFSQNWINPQKLLDEINKFTPAEIICNDAFLLSGVDVADLKGRLGICVFALDPWYFDDQLCQKTLKEHFHVGNLEGLGIGDYDSGIIASGALFLYLKETQKTALSHMASIRPYSAGKIYAHRQLQPS